MRLKSYHWAVLSCAASLLLCLPLASCGARTSAPDSATGFDLPWPPPAGAALKAVSDTVVVLGKDYSTVDGYFSVIGDTLQLTGTPHWSYAIYTVGGLSAANECRSVSIDTSGAHTTPGSGTEMYIGLSHYGSNRWLWYSNIAANWNLTFTVPGEFRSPAGTFSVAVVVVGDGDSIVDSLHFTVDLLDVTVPQNLTATAEVELITLDWDDVPDAVGYNVYRDGDPGFATAIKVNATPVTESTYLDDTVVRGVILYYRVTAVLFTESGYSNQVDIWSPEVDMPAPQNPHFVSNTESSFTVGWDWAGADPSGGFNLYIADTPNFKIDELTEEKTVPPFARKSTFQDLQQGVIYYWRICARTSSGSRGRMTDDLPGQCGGSWTWGPVESVGAGSNPFSATINGTDLAVAYFDGVEPRNVDVALRNAGAWTVEDPGLNITVPDRDSIQVPPPAKFPGGFGSYIGLTYGGGELMCCAYYPSTMDLYGSARVGGVWPGYESVDADGASGVGSPNQGVSCVAAADATDFAVLYLVPGDAGDADEYVTTRAISSGTWERTKLRDLSTTSVYHSLQFDAGDLYVLLLDVTAKDLLFGSRSGGYALTDIAGVDANRGMYNNLRRVLGNWMTTAYDPVDYSLYAISGDGTTWDAGVIAPGTSSTKAGQMARLAPSTSGAFTTFYAQNPNGWRLGIYDGTSWLVYRIYLGGVTFDGSLDVLALGDTPYIIFRDSVSGEIKCAMGTPPAP